MIRVQRSGFILFFVFMVVKRKLYLHFKTLRTLCISSKVNLLSSIAQNYESGVIFLRQSVFSFPRSPGITPGDICPGRDPWFHFVDHVTFTQSSLAQSERRTEFKGTGLYWFLLRQILILGNV